MRSHRYVYSILICCALLGAGLLPSPAANKPKVAPPPDMRKMIKSVDAASSSVVIVYMNDQQTHTYKIDDVTTLNVNGNPGKLADVKPGMVVADYVERDNDDLDSLTLTGFGGSTEPAKAAAKPKPKPKPKPATSPAAST